TELLKLQIHSAGAVRGHFCCDASLRLLEWRQRNDGQVPYSSLNAPLMVLFNKTKHRIFGTSRWWCSSPLWCYLDRHVRHVGVALMIAAWALQNALFYLFGLTFVVVSAAILDLADPIFISEIAPKEHKGFFTASVLSFAGVFAGFCLILAREDIWGTPENWGRIAVLAEFLNIFVLLAGLFLPDSPGKCKESTISVFCTAFPQIYGYFPRRAMGREAMILLNFIITIPISWFGPLAVDRLGKKRVVMMLLGFLIFKTTLHFINGQVQFWGLSYLNAFLQRVIEVPVAAITLCSSATDLLPLNSLLAMMASWSLLGLLASISPFTFGHFLREYLICITLFSTGMAVLVLWLWRRVENEGEQPADQEPLLRKCSPPPEYSALT
ncbi:unnamed protein product, partial [Mesorhabditis spiculigera]